MALPQGFRRNGPAHVAGPSHVEDIEARAARLGITIERVLEQYASLAFADLRRIVEWDDKGMKFRADPPDDMLAIIEIVAAAGSGRPYRIKLHDKKPVLDAIARHLGMFPSTQAAQNEDQQQTDDIEANQELERRLARLAATADKKSVHPVTAAEAGGAV